MIHHNTRSTGKTQTVRLLDVFVFGPFIMYSALRAEKSLQLPLFLIGLGTVLYNGANYLELQK